MRTRVLIVDDEDQVLDCLSKLLEAAGYDVVGKARTGGEVPILAALLHPDVILLDVKLPDMDGFQVAEEIQKSYPMPIVLATAYCDQDLVNRAVDAGVFAYVTKPFRLADVMSAIEVAIRRHADAMGLQKEIDRLGDALESRKWIEKAKGILMKTRGLDEIQAHRYMQLESQRRSQPVADLARAIVTANEMLAVKIIG